MALRLVLLPLVVAAALPVPASGAWTLEFRICNPEAVLAEYHDLPTVILGVMIKGGESGRIEGRCGQASGWAWAQDTTGSGDHAIDLSGLAYEETRWIHLPPGLGEIEISQSAGIKGGVKVRNGEGAASASGFARSRYKMQSNGAWTGWHDTRATLENCNRSTSRQQWAQLDVTLNLSGGSGSGSASTTIPLYGPVIGQGMTESLGSGPSGPGVQTSPVEAYCPVDAVIARREVFIRLQARTESPLLALWSSMAGAEAEGRADYVITLFDRTICPANSQSPR